MSAQIDPTDPMFKPLTLEQVLEITGRTRRTIERWVKDGHLTKYEETHRRKIVLYNEEEVAEAEKERNDAAIENRERIRRRGGRPGPRKPPGETTA